MMKKIWIYVDNLESDNYERALEFLKNIKGASYLLFETIKLGNEINLLIEKINSGLTSREVPDEIYLFSNSFPETSIMLIEPVGVFVK